MFYFCIANCFVLGYAFSNNSPVSLLKTHALYSSIRNRIAIETLDSASIFNQVDHILDHPHIDFFVVSSFGFLVFALIYNLNDRDRISIIKLRQFHEYSSIEKHINIFMCSILYILFKSVDSAY
jgi:hypothetical protein